MRGQRDTEIVYGCILYGNTRNKYFRIQRLNIDISFTPEMVDNLLSLYEDSLENEVCEPGDMIFQQLGDRYGFFNCIKNQITHSSNITLSKFFDEMDEEILYSLTTRWDNRELYFTEAEWGRVVETVRQHVIPFFG